jgi:DNA-directed RNA polymerase specialized sigma24 family protein
LTNCQKADAYCVRFFILPAIHPGEKRQFNWRTAETLLPCGADSILTAMTDHQLQNHPHPASPTSPTFMDEGDEGLAHLLRWLSPDEEQAGQHYTRLRERLIELFARRGVPSSTLEELADETLDRVGHKLASGEVILHPEPMAYVYGVARNVLSEHWRRQTRQAQNEVQLENLSPRDRIALESKRHQQEERQEMEVLLECLDEYLKTLPPEDAALLRTCHHDDSRLQAARRRAAARRLGLAESSLRAHLHRIRQTLERKVRACVERRQK